MEQETRKAPDQIINLFPDASVVTSDFQSEFYQVLRNDNLKSVDFFIDSDVSKWNPEGFTFSRQLDSLKIKGVGCTFVIDHKPSLNDVKSEDLTNFMSIIFKNSFAVGQLDVKGLQPLILVTMLDGRQVLYFSEQANLQFNSNWGTDRVFCTNYHSGSVFERLDPSRFMQEFSKNYENAVFEFSIFNPNSSTSSLLDTLTKQDEDSWNKVFSALSGKRADILYTDKYVRSPLGCYIVSSVLGQIIKKCRLSVNSLSFQLAPLEPERNRPARYGEALLENFGEASQRDAFLRECVVEQCGKTPSISQINQQHFRSLTIVTEDFECSIRPDGGFSWGWKLDRSAQGMNLDDLKYDLTQDIGLFNYAARNSGILYTVALKKK